MHSAIVPVPARRHPHQVLVALLLMVSGLPILFGGPTPGSVASTLPAPLVYVWAGVLAVGGALVVAAALVGPDIALYLEVVADLPLCLGCVTYATAVAIAAGDRGLLSAAIFTAAGVAFGIRYWQVLKTLRELRLELNRRSEWT